MPLFEYIVQIEANSQEAADNLIGIYLPIQVCPGVTDITKIQDTGKHHVKYVEEAVTE